MRSISLQFADGRYPRGRLHSAAVVPDLPPPGQAVTRHTIAASQMLSSALLVHLSGGRMETHFHPFGSLAFLAFYRDWRVLATATAVLTPNNPARDVSAAVALRRAGGHVSRGAGSSNRPGSLFEDVFLIYACIQRGQEMHAIAERQAELEDSQGSVERTVTERTAQVAAANRDLGKQIGERQRVEQELRAAQNDLEAKVRERTAELGAANRALKRQIDEGRKTEDELARSIQRLPVRDRQRAADRLDRAARWRLDYFNRRFHEYTGMLARGFA